MKAAPNPTPQSFLQTVWPPYGGAWRPSIVTGLVSGGASGSAKVPPRLTKTSKPIVEIRLSLMV